MRGRAGRASWHRLLPAPAIALLFSIAVLAGIWGLRLAGQLQPHELRAYDALLRVLRMDATADPRVTLVAIGEDDIARHKHPLPDGVLAAAIERLLAHGPRVVGIDLFRDNPVLPGSERLERLLRDDARIVAVMGLPDDSGKGVGPPPAIEDPERIGFADMVEDPPDGRVRRGLLIMGGGDDAAWSFALRLAMAYLAPLDIFPEDDARSPGQLRLGAVSYPRLRAHQGGYAGIDDLGYQFLLTYPAGLAGFTTLSLQEVLDGSAGPELVRDRVVILGTKAPSVKDLFKTPLTREGSELGAALHAQIVSQLIRQALGEARPLRPMPAPVDIAWTGLWCVLGGLAALWLHRPVLLLATAVAGPGLLAASAAALLALGWWIAAVPPLLGALATLLLTASYLARLEHADRAMLRQLFATHLSPRIAEALWQARDALVGENGLRPQSLEATVLFSDVRGYTTVAEAMTPSILLGWLNEYVGTMADIVARHDGVVLELTGDGVVAVFGIPIPRTAPAEIADDAQRAVRCAVAMGDALAGLNAGFRARGLPEAAIRVGIHTGPLVAGSLGSAARRKYAVVGDTVNVAARLESYDKAGHASASEQAHCRILVSGATYACLGGKHRAVLVGKLDLKGRSGLIAVYRVLDPAGRASLLEDAG
jgi:adenylate cyclase